MAKKRNTTKHEKNPTPAIVVENRLTDAALAALQVQSLLRLVEAAATELESSVAHRLDKVLVADIRETVCVAGALIQTGVLASIDRVMA